MLMPYKHVPSKENDNQNGEMTMKYVSGSSKARNNIYPIQSPRQLVTGEPLYLPLCQIGQYDQGICGGDNSTGNDYIDCLYIGPKNGSSGHWVLSLKIRQRI